METFFSNKENPVALYSDEIRLRAKSQQDILDGAYADNGQVELKKEAERFFELDRKYFKARNLDDGIVEKYRKSFYAELETADSLKDTEQRMLEIRRAFFKNIYALQKIIAELDEENSLGEIYYKSGLYVSYKALETNRDFFYYSASKIRLKGDTNEEMDLLMDQMDDSRRKMLTEIGFAITELRLARKGKNDVVMDSLELKFEDLMKDERRYGDPYYRALEKRVRYLKSDIRQAFNDPDFRKIRLGEKENPKEAEFAEFLSNMERVLKDLASQINGYNASIGKPVDYKYSKKETIAQEDNIEFEADEDNDDSEEDQDYSSRFYAIENISFNLEGKLIGNENVLKEFYLDFKKRIEELASEVKAYSLKLSIKEANK